MIPDREAEILARALFHHGFRRQARQLGEECSELAAAVFRLDRPEREDALDGFLEELADVSLVVDQMRIWLSSDAGALEAFQRHRAEKLARVDAYLDRVGAGR